MRKATGPRRSSSPACRTASLAAFALFVLPLAGPARAGDDWKGPLVLVEEPAPRANPVAVSAAASMLAMPSREGTRILFLEPGKGPRVLAPGFSGACDPCVSTDGRRVLFSGKEKADDVWNIFEVSIDGTGLRKITEDLGNCREPEYLAVGATNPPDYDQKVRWILFTSDANGQDLGGGARSTSLYVRSLEPVPGRGFVTWRTTFNLASDFSPTVLSDGRVLYSSWQHVPGFSPRTLATAPAPVVKFLTISWSGEDINLFCGDEPPAIKSMARETADRAIVYIEGRGGAPDRSGDLARVWMRRPLRLKEVLARGPGRYRDPRPLPDGSLLVSFAPEGGRFGLHLFDFEKGGPGKLVHARDGWDSVDAVPVVTRREPQGRITMVDDSAKTATLTCLNVYDSARPEIRALPRGAVKKVRFVEGVRAASGGRVPALSGELEEPQLRILGDAPVEPDGSFLVEIVPETPFFIQLLDESGMALGTMSSWIWLRPRDERSCMGCHEDREMSPANHVPEAIVRAKLWPVLTPPDERRVVDFDRDISGIVERRCASCHAGESPAGGTEILVQDPAQRQKCYEVLRARSVPGSARESELVLRLLGRKPADAACALKEPGETEAFVEWVDLGLPWQQREVKLSGGMNSHDLRP